MEHKVYEFSYYHGNDDRDSRKIILQAELSDNRLNIKKSIVDFTFDTGAIDVVCSAAALGITITEEQFIDKFNTACVYRRGIAHSVSIRYYRYELSEFRLGNLRLYNVPIYISFERDAKSRLIGMSLLRFFDILIRPEFKQVKLTETDTLLEYLKEHGSLKDCDKYAPETYLDFGIEQGTDESNTLDEQAAEAAYINKLLKSNLNRRMTP